MFWPLNSQVFPVNTAKLRFICENTMKRSFHAYIVAQIRPLYLPVIFLRAEMIG